MRDFGIVLAALLLVFMFHGEPDLFDKLHTLAHQWADAQTQETSK